MAYENNPNFVDETLGKKFYCVCGNHLKNLTVMAPMKNLIQEKYLKNLKLVRLKEWLFVIAANPANFLFVMVLTQNYEHRF